MEAIIIYNLDISKNEYFLLDIIDNSERILHDFEKIWGWYPLQYVVRTSEFYGREFYVDRRVLIPRIDTELMIDCVKNNNYSENTNYLDIWTGSWIIPITLCLELSRNTYAFDISEDALDVCKTNIKKYKLDDKLKVYTSDLLEKFEDLELEKNKKLVITANLPYIKDEDFQNMSESTILHEPDLALYGWKETWFEMYEKLIAQCEELHMKGYDIDLFIEIGFDQKNIASDFLIENQLDFEFHKDSATIERVVEIHFK